MRVSETKPPRRSVTRTTCGHGTLDHDSVDWLSRNTGCWRCFVGDKGKKDKEKGQKQHAAKDKQEDRKKLEKQPKRTA